MFLWEYQPRKTTTFFYTKWGVTKIGLNITAVNALLCALIRVLVVLYIWLGHCTHKNVYYQFIEKETKSFTLTVCKKDVLLLTILKKLKLKNGSSIGMLENNVNNINKKLTLQTNINLFHKRPLRIFAMTMAIIIWTR